MGFIRETAIERLWRDARVLAIGGGATDDARRSCQALLMSPGVLLLRLGKTGSAALDG